MMRCWFFILLLSLCLQARSQEPYVIETSDITRFWQAFDQLANAGSKEDSIQIIRDHYINQASKHFREFLKVRKFTAEEYVEKIGLYPLFWKSVRPLTEGIDKRKGEIDKIFQQLEVVIPNFRQPDVCFAIGTLRTGGTTSKNLLLIGADIAASDSTVEKSELSPWLRSVIGNTGDIVAMVAHETIHTHQINYRKTTLLTGSIKEGVADFITDRFLGLNINRPLHDYGNARECELWTEFETSMKTVPGDYSLWLYGGKSSGARPADLGYYIGYKIAEAYYDQATNKEAAIKTLLNQKKYPEIFRRSGYSQKACSR